MTEIMWPVGIDAKIYDTSAVSCLLLLLLGFEFRPDVDDFEPQPC